MYLGHMVAGRFAKKSYKSKELYRTPPEQWVEVKNMHQAIIDEDTFVLANKNLSIRRRVIKKTGIQQIFQGLLFCADCGKHMSYSSKKNGKDKYTCSRYRLYGRALCTSHFIHYQDIYKIVLEDINEIIYNFKLNPQALVVQIMKSTESNGKNDKLQIEKEIAKCEKRVIELNHIIQKLYEDSVLSSIGATGLSQQRLSEMLSTYDKEQEELKQKIMNLKASLIEFADKQDKTNQFMQLISKYDTLTQLTAPILNELIAKVVIHEGEYPVGYNPKNHRFKRIHKTQRVDIYYNHIGIIVPLQASINHSTLLDMTNH
jgi:hypothetical protein